MNGLQFRRQDRNQLHVFTHHPAEHSIHVLNQRIEIQHRRFDHLALAEGQQLACKIGGSLSRFHHLFDIAARRIAGMHRVQQYLRIAGDNHQQIVEVVRNAAGQPANRFQSLRMVQLLFQAQAVRDVARIDNQAIHAGQMRQIASERFEHAPGAVFVAEPAL